MKTGSKRLDNALSKLYTAFHNGELDAMNCSKCGAGNICNNTSGWVDARESSWLGRVHDGWINTPDVVESIKDTGYSIYEIVAIEKAFLEGMGYEKSGAHEYSHYIGLPQKERHEANFKGMCSLIQYLCELDNIPNVMDIKGLFEYDKEGKAINEFI